MIQPKAFLTLTEFGGTGRTLLIDINSIVAIKSTDYDGAQIFMLVNEPFFVEQSPSEVMTAMSDLYRRITGHD